MTLATANTLVGFGTFALQLLTVGLFLVYVLGHRVSSLSPLARMIGTYGMLAATALSLAASSVTVYYSSVLGLEPCPLCWWQRVFLYPQLVLFIVALVRRERVIAWYSIVLSIVGLGIALYQHVLQVLPGSGLPCPATGVSCAQRFLFEFNYITYPLAAATVFACLIALMLFVRRER